jgi:MFS family permease
MVAQIREGIRFVLVNAILRRIVIAAGALNLFSGAVLALEMLFLARDLHLSGAVIGIVFSVQGAVGVAASFAVSRLTAAFGVGRALIVGLLVEGLGAAVFSLAAGPTWSVVAIVVIANAVYAFAGPLFNVNSISLRQAITPRHLLGRVNATARLMIMGSRPLGSLVGGIAAGPVGARPVLAVAAAGMVAASLWLLFTDVRRVRHLSDVTPAPEVSEKQRLEGRNA